MTRAPARGSLPRARRDVYLTRDERKALIEALPDGCAAFARGLCALPLRPGALVALTVGDFDKRLGTLKVGKDKAGEARRIALPDTTAALLREQSRGKLPAAPLFARADGAAWSKDYWKGPIKHAVRAAALADNVTACALRHSAITDLIAEGVPTATVADLAGTSIKWAVWVSGNWRLTFAFDDGDAVLVDYQDDH